MNLFPKLVLAILLLSSLSFGARTFYVSSSTGSDSYSGTSKATPWQHIRGMAGATGNAAAYVPTAGDSIYFMGGDSWHYSASKGVTGINWRMMDNTGPWRFSQANPGYIGVDRTWFNASACSAAVPMTVNTTASSSSVVLASGGPFFTGAAGWGIVINGTQYTVQSVADGSHLTLQSTVAASQSGVSAALWCRPVLDGDNPPSISQLGGSCPYLSPVFIDSGLQYATFEGFEFKGICFNNTNANQGGGKSLGYIQDAALGNVTYRDLYMHGWTHEAISGGNSQVEGIGSNSGDVNVLYDSIVIDGSDSDHGVFAALAFNVFDVRNSVIRYVCNGSIGNGGHRISNNLYEYVFPCIDGAHDNVMEWNRETSGVRGGSYIFNNVIRHNINSLNFWTCPLSGMNDYYFNNVMYDGAVTKDGGPGQMWDVDNGTGQAGCTSQGVGNWYNNTFVHGNIGPGAAPWNANLKSNLWIDGGGWTPSPTSSVNMIQATAANATTYGYTAANNYAPTSADCNGNGASSTCPIGRGVNLTATCSTLDALEPGVGTALCSDTTMGPKYDTVYHRVNGNARTAVARPTSTAWDVGAYQVPTTPKWDTPVQLTCPTPTTCLGTSVIGSSGYADTNNRQAVRTSDGHVYIVGVVSTFQQGGTSYVKIWKSDQTGSPTSFSEIDSANRPSCASRVGGAEIRMADDGIIQLAYDCINSGTDGTAIYVQIPTTGGNADKYGVKRTIGTYTFNASTQRYHSKIGLAVDLQRKPHVFWGPYINGAVYESVISSGTYPTETWTANTLPITGMWRPSAQFDTSGNLHVAFIDLTHMAYLQKSAAGVWSSAETIASTSDDFDTGGGIVDSGPSLAIMNYNGSAGAQQPVVSWTGVDSGTASSSLTHYRVRTAAGVWTTIPLPTGTGNIIKGHSPITYVDSAGNLYGINGHQAVASNPCTAPDYCQPYFNWWQKSTSSWMNPFSDMTGGQSNPERDAGGGGRYDNIWPGSTNDIDYVTMVEDPSNGGQLTYIHGTGVVVASTYSISGTISNGAGSAVALTGTATASTTADGSGNYSFTGLLNGSYTITPSKSGYTFSPASSTQTVSGANIPGVNFTASLPVYSCNFASGTRNCTITSGGVSRSFGIHVPTNFTAGNGMVFYFHGSTGGTNEGWSQNWDATSDKYGFVAVTPAGLQADSGSTTWNCFWCDWLWANHTYANMPDDVQLFRDITAVIQANLNTSPNKVYATGFSSGAYMAHRIGIQAADIVAAISPGEGGYFNLHAPDNRAIPNANGPVSVLFFNGDADTTTYYCGNSNATLTIPDVDTTINYWATQDSCTSVSPASALCSVTMTGATGTDTCVSGNGLCAKVATNCSNNTEIYFYDLENGQHHYFGGTSDGGTPAGLPLNVGCPSNCTNGTPGTATQPYNEAFNQTTGIYKNDIIWNFFSTHAKGASLTHSISGTVSPSLGTLDPNPGVTIAATGKTSQSTASDGSYIFSPVSNGVYTVTPSKTGYSFSPTSSSVTINNNNGLANFTASGTPVVSLDHSSLSFGSVTIGQTLNSAVVLSNTGTAALGFSTSMATTGEFSIYSNTCSPSGLAAATSCTITIRFTPTSTGCSAYPCSKSGTLYLYDTGAAGSPHTVSLSGSAITSFQYVLGNPNGTGSFTWGIPPTPPPSGAPMDYSAVAWTEPHNQLNWPGCGSGDCSTVWTPQNPLPGMGNTGGSCYTFRGTGYSCLYGINTFWIDETMPGGKRHRYGRATDATTASASMGTNDSGNQTIRNADGSLWMFTTSGSAKYLVQVNTAAFYAGTSFINGSTQLTNGTDFAFDPITPTRLWIWNMGTGDLSRDDMTSSGPNIYTGTITHHLTTIANALTIPGSCFTSAAPGNWNSIFFMPYEGTGMSLAVGNVGDNQEQGHCVMYYKFDPGTQNACTHSGQCGWRFLNTSPGSVPVPVSDPSCDGAGSACLSWSTGPAQITGQYGPTGTALQAEDGTQFNQTFGLHSDVMTPPGTHNQMERAANCSSTSAAWAGHEDCQGPWEWFFDTLYIASCKKNTTSGNCSAVGHGKNGMFGRWGGHYSAYQAYGTVLPGGPFFSDNANRTPYIGPDIHYAGGNNDDHLDDKPWFESTFCSCTSPQCVSVGSNCTEEFPSATKGFEQMLVAVQPVDTGDCRDASNNTQPCIYTFGPNYSDGNNQRFLGQLGNAVISPDGCMAAISADGKGQFGTEGSSTDAKCDIYNLTTALRNGVYTKNACRGDVIFMDLCHAF